MDNKVNQTDIKLSLTSVTKQYKVNIKKIQQLSYCHTKRLAMSI